MNNTSTANSSLERDMIHNTALPAHTEVFKKHRMWFTKYVCGKQETRNAATAVGRWSEWKCEKRQRTLNTSSQDSDVSTTPVNGAQPGTAAGREARNEICGSRYQRLQGWYSIHDLGDDVLQLLQ